MGETELFQAIVALTEQIKAEREAQAARLVDVENIIYGHEGKNIRGLCETLRGHRREITAAWCVIGIIIGVLIRSLVGP